MSRRWGRAIWRTEVDSDELRWASEAIQRIGFWTFVDSQPAYGVDHRGECDEHVTGWGEHINICSDWTHRRDSEWCIAANSQRQRCSARAEAGLPFCVNHFDAVWTAMNAYVIDDRHRCARVSAETDRRSVYLDASIDVAAVLDARRLLEQGAERVYFFATGEVVKIGRSLNPDKRVKTLKGTKAPEGVDIAAGRLLGTIPGGCRVESELHRLFRAHRLVGEWFSLPPIREHIEQIIEQRCDEEQATA